MLGVDTCNLAIIIVNYRTPALVEDCLTHLLPDLEKLDAVAVVADNFSNDGSVDRLEKWLADFPARNSVKLLRSAENTGFSGGNNMGIKSQRADYYLLLNSDAYVLPGAIEALLETARGHPEAGVVGPLLECPDGTPQSSCFRYHSPVSELISAAATGPITKLLKAYDVPLPPVDKVIRPQWVSFACALIPGTVFQEVGLLDDGYFMYYEDADYCRRARDAGWDIIYQPAAHVVHLGGESSDFDSRINQNKRLPGYYYASRTRYFYKHYGKFGLLAANLLWSCGWLIAKLREPFGRPARHISEKQVGDIWLNWWNPLGDRHAPKCTNKN